MHDYLHKVQYYESDQMKVAHHSNYIRWFEEARTDYLDSIDLSYAKMEPRGIISPVLSVECSYHSMTRYGETVRVRAWLTEMGNVRYRLYYQVLDAGTGELRAEGTTSHCFIDPAGKVISLKRADPAAFERMRAELDVPPVRPRKAGASRTNPLEKL